MTPFEKYVIRKLRELNRTYGAVKSYLLAIKLHMCDRTMRWWLKKLEAAGVVERPNGKHSGWVVA